jgi:hypothetical protein
MSGTILLKIVDQGLRILPDIAEVYCFPAFGEEEETIEFLEQNSGRLVDSAKNSLAVIRELSEQSADRPRSLGVKTRGWFIEEEEESRLRSKLNTNSEALSLFNIETCCSLVEGPNYFAHFKTRENVKRTFTRNSNNGIGIGFHLQDLDNLIDIRNLLVVRGRLRLTENGAECQSLSDG